MKEEHTVNDENNRRLSNGSMQPPAPATLAPAATAAAIGGDEPASPPRPLSLASPLGRSQGVRGSVESSAWGGSSWDPSVSGTGTRSVASSSAARPSFRTLSASSTVEHDRDGDDERHGFDRHRHDERLESSTEEGRPGGDCLSPLGSPASAAFAGIANADAAADAGVLASPAPGRKSKLFRRVSRLPRTSLEEFDHQDGGFGGEADEGDGSEDGKHAGGGGGGGGGALNGHTQNLVICRADSGVSSAGSGGGKCDNGGGSGGGGGGSRQFSGSGDEGGVSTDTSSVGRKGGLGKGFGEGRPRAHGRRDAVLQEMRPEPRGRGSGRDKDKEKGGPRLGAAGGAGASRSESAKERRRGKGDTPGDTGRGGVVRGEELQHRQQSRTKHRLYPNSGSSTAVTHSGASKHRKPAVTPSGKKPLAGGGVGSPTPSQQAHKPSSRAAPTSESRQPLSKHPITPKAKVPSRTVVTAAGTAGAVAVPGRPTPAPKAQIQTGRGGFLSPTLASQSRSRSPRPKAEDARSARLVEEPGCGEEGVAAGPVLPPRISVVVPWEKHLRTESKAPPKKDPLPTMASKKDGTLKRAMGKGRKGGGWGGGWGGGGDFGGGGGGGMDGRPSIGTWTKTQNYLQILKELSGKDEEELEWLAVAKEGKGVTKSERRQESAETEYHRLLCEESIQQAGLKLLQDRRLEVALKSLSKMGGDLGRLTELLEELSGQESAIDAEDEEGGHQDAAAAKASSAAASEGGAGHWDEQASGVEVAATERDKRQREKERLGGARGEAESKLSQLLENIGKGKKKLQGVRDVLRQESKDAPGTGGTALTTIVGITADVTSARELITPDRAKSGLRGLQRAAVSLSEKLNKTRIDSQSALGRMEKWRERKEALPEYEQEVADKERAWFRREEEKNAAALRRMRALCPVGVTGLTVAQLEERAIEEGSLYPRELSLRLKENRLLHWTVEHPDDIARSNFLRGDHAHFFTNLDRYDLVELRAVTACLPERFEVDGDGRKAAWRAAFLQRVQGLVAQERGDTVSGGWDPEAGARRTVRLPALSAEQARRAEYFYPTAAQVAERVEKLRDRRRRIDARKAKLEEVKGTLLPEARQEYANVLEDTRHPANREAFPAEDLRRARDEAKAEVDRLAKEAKRLEADVASAERALAEGPYTVESLEAEAEQTKALLLKRAEKRRRLLLAEREKRRKERELREKERRERRERQAEEMSGASAAPGAAVEKESAGGDAGAVVGDAEDQSGSGSPGGSCGTNSSSNCGNKGEDNKGAGDTADADVATESKEEGEGEVVAEGLEVEGAFEPEPELRSRFGDKSNSLRFVTAEEDARMRKEELAKVFGARDAAGATDAAAAAVAGGATGPPPDGGDGATAGQEDQKNFGGDGEAGSERVRKTVAAMTSDLQGANAASEEAGQGVYRHPDAGLVVGRTSREKRNMVCAQLEEMLSRGGRAPPPGTTSGGGGDGGGGGGPRNLASGLSGKGTFSTPTRQGGARAAGEKSDVKAAVLSPPCEPKSKFFRSMQSPTRGDSDAATQATAAGPSILPPPPSRPPAPQLGFLSEIVSRGGARAGEKKAVPGGLFAEIRARAGKGSGASAVETGFGGAEEKGDAPTTTTTTTVASLGGGSVAVLPPPPAAAGMPPPPPPPPPSVGLKPRALFASGGRGGGGAAAPPLNMFAELKAKAAARQAKRREEGEEDEDA